MANKTMNKVEIDLAKCNGCKVCVDACFVDVIKWDAKEEKPVAAYQEDCVWCLACEDACPAQCINVIPAIPGHFAAPY